MGTWILDQLVVLTQFFPYIWVYGILDQLVVLILPSSWFSQNPRTGQRTQTNPTTQPSSSFPRNHPHLEPVLWLFSISWNPRLFFFFSSKFSENWKLEVISKIWAPHCCCTLPAMINYFIFFLCFHMIFNNLSLFMSMLNLIWININFTDIIRHLLICFFISMLEGREKESSNYIYSSLSSSVTTTINPPTHPPTPH